MNNTIFTIGYTAFNIEKFINILEFYSITCLIDVRSTPKSVYYKDYNEENLKSILKNNKILYRNYKEEFGARQESKQFYSNDGYLDFELFAQSIQFNEGIEKIRLAQKRNHTICLMCAEKDPIRCHRAILVGRQLVLNGFNVKHILPDGKTCSQNDIDARLIDEYFPNYNQLSIFSEENISYEARVKKAYALKNKEIGFIMEDEE